MGYVVSLWVGWSSRAPALSASCAKKPVTDSISSILRKFWRFGWPLSLWFAGQLLLPLIDRTLIANQLGLRATGNYAALSDILTRCFSLAVFPLIQAIYPRLTKLAEQENRSGVRSLLRRAALLLLFAGLVSLPVLYHLRDWVVGMALPSPGILYTDLVLPLALGGFIWHVALLVHKPLELATRTRHMLAAMIVAVVVKTLLTWTWLPQWGMQGAAVATLVAGVVYCFICLVMIKGGKSH